MPGKRWQWLGGLLGFLAAVMLVDQIGHMLWHSAATQAAESKPAAPPPLKINREAPLLLLDEPAPAAKAPAAPAGKPRADNEPCYVCHGNYREEPLVQWHVPENVGCVECHGSSAAHRDDEDNITPPDIIYPAHKIDAQCQKCHEDHVAPARKVIGAWQKKCPAKTDPTSIVCTDCHGAHRLAARTVRWDKTTRKLIGQKSAAKTEPLEKME